MNRAITDKWVRNARLQLAAARRGGNRRAIQAARATLDAVREAIRQIEQREREQQGPVTS